MKLVKILVAFVAFLGLVSCSKPSKFVAYNGPDITSIVVQKENRRMFLMNGNSVVKAYDFELGFTPVGQKQFEGDGKTPEGTYRISHRNPRSAYHLSLGISYPNTRDAEFARSQGKKPGGDIFIHGTPKSELGKDDWTAGCIAVTNEEIEEIYAMVKDGTPIFIYP